MSIGKKPHQTTDVAVRDFRNAKEWFIVKKPSAILFHGRSCTKARKPQGLIALPVVYSCAAERVKRKVFCVLIPLSACVCAYAKIAISFTCLSQWP